MDIEYSRLQSLPAATKLGQGNIFTSVCLSTGGGLSACWDTTPLGADPLREQTPPLEQTPPWEQTPPGADPPRSRHAPGSRHPLEQNPPQSRHPPGTQYTPREADSGIWSTSGQYASYWNAFLFGTVFCKVN